MSKRKISEIIRDAALYRLAANERQEEEEGRAEYSCDAVLWEDEDEGLASRRFAKHALPTDCQGFCAFNNRKRWTFEQKQSARFMWPLFCSYLARDEGL